MSSTKSGRRGRPKTYPDTGKVTLVLAREQIHAAEALVPEFDRASALGTRHSRTDVLRAAVTKGLEVLSAQVKS